MLSMRYACKIRQCRSHPAYSSVFSDQTLRMFQGGRRRRSVPFCIRAHALLEESGIQLRKVKRLTYLPIPPWELASPNVDLSLTLARKSDITPTEQRARALELIATYEECVACYTDGSKTDTGVCGKTDTGVCLFAAATRVLLHCIQCRLCTQPNLSPFSELYVL